VPSTAAQGSSGSSGSAAAPSAAAAASGRPDWTSIAAAAAPSVVTVAVSDGEGSGVVLDAQGHILTNDHVISGAGSGGIQVTLTDGRTYAATVVGADPTTDLAVLKLSTVPSGVRPATFGDSSVVKVGDQVMAMGNPLGLSDTVTTGIVSAVNRPVSTASSEGGASGDPSGPFGGAGDSGRGRGPGDR
jgi:putative serine protease PepD